MNHIVVILELQTISTYLNAFRALGSVKSGASVCTHVNTGIIVTPCTHQILVLLTSVSLEALCYVSDPPCRHGDGPSDEEVPVVLILCLILHPVFLDTCCHGNQYVKHNFNSPTRTIGQCTNAHVCLSIYWHPWILYDTTVPRTNYTCMKHNGVWHNFNLHR